MAVGPLKNSKVAEEVTQVLAGVGPQILAVSGTGGLGSGRDPTRRTNCATNQAPAMRRLSREVLDRAGHRGMFEGVCAAVKRSRGSAQYCRLRSKTHNEDTG